MSKIIDVDTDSGRVGFCYSISTPTEAIAEEIDPRLPCVVFIHPVYIPQAIFHAQFIDPDLRRFNMISVDARGQGRTRGPVPENFSPKHVAADIRKFLDALNVGKCHVVSLSLGSISAIQFAMDYPQDTLSLTCISPAPLEETEHAREGLTQIHECWESCFQNIDNVDDNALVETLFGAAQFAVNDFLTDTVKGMFDSVIRQTLTDATQTWVGPNFDGFAATTIKMTAHRIPPTREQLGRIACPMRLIACSADLVYSLADSEGLRDALLAAGVDIPPLYVIQTAPHFGNLFFPEQVNPIILDLILSHTEEEIPPSPTAESLQSPYVERLMQFLPHDDSDSDDDFFIA